MFIATLFTILKRRKLAQLSMTQPVNPSYSENKELDNRGSKPAWTNGS
jgi:hypothetical protein